MDEPTTTQEVSTIASLMLYVKDKVFYDGDDIVFLKVKDDLIKAEKLAGKHPIYHLEFLPDNPYTTSEGKQAKGRWCLWNRIDWDLAQEKWAQDKAASDERVERHNNVKSLFTEICECVAKQICSETDDEIVKSIATIITNTKNRILGKQYGVSEELMNKVWGEEQQKNEYQNYKRER